MLSLRTLQTAPLPLLRYIGNGKYSQGHVFDDKDGATEYWLYQDCGESYMMKWWQNGWVVCFQESYLTKELTYRHKSEIPSFDYSHYGEAEGWHHVFETRGDAVVAFIQWRKNTWHDIQEAVQ